MNSSRLQDIKSAYKNVIFLYSNSEHIETGSKNTISFTITPKILNYLGVNITKYVQEFYAVKCKTDEKNQRSK